MKNENKLISAGLLTAITASLCCITPILALIAGTSGVVSTFSWIEPFRTYLVGLTLIVLGFAWYQKLNPKNEIDCECEPEEKPKFMQSKMFLALVTVFAILMLAAPYYSGLFYGETEKQIKLVNKSDIKTFEFKIKGMTCTGCEEHVNHEITQLAGIVNSNASYESGTAIVEFDKSKTNEKEIEEAIKATGYEISEKIEN